MSSVPASSGVEAVLSSHERSRSELIPILQEVQEAQGYLSVDAIDRIAEFLGLSSNDVYGVATFYAQFRYRPVGKHMIKVCQGTACHVRGGKQILEAVQKELGIKTGDTTEDGEYTLERVACFGSCALAPVVVIDDVVYGRMSPQKTQELLKESK